MATYGAALEALADPTRRAVLEQLREGPQAVGEIAAHLPVSRPAVSQHLKVLKGAGLVTDRAEGTRRLYAVSPDGLVVVSRQVRNAARMSCSPVCQRRFKMAPEKS